MKERPILMTGPLVVETLADRKTQTRRLYKPRQPAPWEVVDDDGDGVWLHWIDEAGDAHRVACPYGVPGDKLWGRERMRVVSVKAPRGRWAIRVRYEADGSESAWLEYPERLKSLPVVGKCLPYGGYREASRITLDVTSVRVERLQEISEKDARAEGVTPLGPSIGADQPILDTPRRGRTQGTHPHVLAFGVLWDTINGDRALWTSNPWVWVVSFRRICQCTSDIEDPGPRHLPSCPWSDPNYSVVFP